MSSKAMPSRQKTQQPMDTELRRHAAARHLHNSREEVRTFTRYHSLPDPSRLTGPKVPASQSFGAKPTREIPMHRGRHKEDAKGELKAAVFRSVRRSRKIKHPVRPLKPPVPSKVKRKAEKRKVKRAADRSTKRLSGDDDDEDSGGHGSEDSWGSGEEEDWEDEERDRLGESSVSWKVEVVEGCERLWVLSYTE